MKDKYNDEPVYTSRIEKYHGKKNKHGKLKNTVHTREKSDETVFNAPEQTEAEITDTNAGIPDDFTANDAAAEQENSIYDAEQGSCPDESVETHSENDNDARRMQPENDMPEDNASDKSDEITLDETIEQQEADIVPSPGESVDIIDETGGQDDIYTDGGSLARENKKLSKTAKAWLITIFCAVAAVCIMLIFIFEIVSAEGVSMQPTVNGGEKIIADKFSRYFEFPERGQVVVTTYDGYDGYYIKRVIAFPGEWVEIYQNTVYINGEPLSEPYLESGQQYDDMELMQVPEDCVFLLGDNRAQSLDSRMGTIGCVNENNIVGNAWCVIWPFDAIRIIE